MRVFKTKLFGRFADRERISDSSLRKAVLEADRGLIGADLGGGVVKQRIARPGSGKSAGYRTIVLFRAGVRAFFVYGFAKSERDNIAERELVGFRMLAARLLAYDDHALAEAIESGSLTEITSDDEGIS